jgi:dGTP triphosphohydrolase
MIDSRTAVSDEAVRAYALAYLAAEEPDWTVEDRERAANVGVLGTDEPSVRAGLEAVLPYLLDALPYAMSDTDDCVECHVRRVKADLEVTTISAGELAPHLPDDIRPQFWRQAVDRYLQGAAAATARIQEAYERGIAEGHRQAAKAIRNADTSGWPGGRGWEVDGCQETAARIAEGTTNADPA